MTVIEIGSKWSEKTGKEFFNEFVQFFPTQKEYNEWLKDKGIYDEDWYPEAEVWEIQQQFGFDIDDFTDEWCDFFNELDDNDW
jgi:hypothetical protein